MSKANDGRNQKNMKNTNTKHTQEERRDLFLDRLYALTPGQSLRFYVKFTPSRQWGVTVTAREMVTNERLAPTASGYGYCKRSTVIAKTLNMPDLAGVGVGSIEAALRMRGYKLEIHVAGMIEIVEITKL